MAVGATALETPRTRSTTTGSGAAWRVTTAQFLLLAAAGTALSGMFFGVGWWLLLVLIAALVLFSGAALRAAGVPRWLAPFLEALVLLATVTAAYGDGLGIALVVPTPASLGALLSLGGRAGTAIAEQSIPAEPVTELMFLVVLGTGVVAMLMDLAGVALRRPALSGIPIALVLLVPVIFLAGGVNLFWLAVCVAAYVWLLRVDVRMRRRAPARPLPSIAVAASVIVIALIVAVTAPGFTPAGSLPYTASGVSLGNGVNPLIDLGKDLRRPRAVPVLTYSTTAVAPPYLKLTTLDRFTGATWTHSRAETKPVPDSDQIGPAPGLDDSVKTTKVRTSISIGQLRSPWLPVPYPVIGVHGQQGAWTWEPRDLTIGSTRASAGQQSYTAVSLDVEPTERQLRDAGGFLPVSVRADLALPDKIPAIITDAAREATKGATSEYERAVALQDYFRYSGFQYSLQTPLEQGYDGDGLAVIATFLEKKSGYCVHFASAMALMARILDIPARVAIGYLPGNGSGVDADGTPQFTVTSDELHSWPELYFSGVGWLAFEPTVGQGVVPAYSVPQQNGSTPAPTEVATSTPSAAAASVAADDAASHDAAGPATPGAGTGLGLLLGAIAVIVLLMLPAIVRQVKRLRLRGLVASAPRPADAVWRELRDTARDLRLPLVVGESARAFAARLLDDWGRPAQAAGPGDPDAAAALLRLRDAVERESFARVAPMTDEARRALVPDLDRVVAALLSRAGCRRRLMAAVAPVSLLPVLAVTGSGYSAPNA